VGRDSLLARAKQAMAISIHAPRVGRDGKSKQKFRKNAQNFKVHYKKERVA